jgi:hypothetical protein
MELTAAMRLEKLVLLASLAVAFVWWPFRSQSEGASAPAAKVFVAAPGTNTLMAARDAVRAWRAAGHTDEAATIRLSRGEYLLTEPLSLSSQDGNATWETPDADNTLIIGGRRITHFTTDPTGLWHAQTGLRFEQLYVNRLRAMRARWPVDGFLKMESVQQKDLPNGKALLTVKLPATDLVSLAANPNSLRGAEIFVFHKWDTSRYRVSSVDPVGGTVTVEGEHMQPWNPWATQSRFIFDNCSLKTPLEPGTWFLNPQGDLSYSPQPGEQLGQAEFIAPIIEKLIEIHGATNLHFNGLRFHYAAYHLPPDGCPPGQAAAAIAAAVQVDDARDVTFEHCEIAHVGNYGIWFRHGCQDCRIQHCLLADLGAGGIRIGETAMRENPAEQTGGIIADNNIVRGCGRVHPSAVGVWIGQSANNRVTHNDLSDTFYTGVSIGWTWGYGRSLATNNFIGFNRIHQIGQGVLSDMGGIYTLGVSPGSACVGNVIFDVRAHDYGGWGIYPDEGSTGWQIESNLVWNCTCVNPHSGGGFHQHYGATNDIANNIFAFSSGPPMQATRVEDHLSFILERNLIVSSNAEFFTGPWDKIQFTSRSNCFAIFGSAAHLFPNGDLAAWQKAGHETDSILTNLVFSGVWPDVTLPRRSPALAIGFKLFDPQVAGVDGDEAWKRSARETENASTIQTLANGFEDLIRK